MTETIYSLPLTKRETNALLHIIAAANSNGRMKPGEADAAICNYLADRILRIREEIAKPPTTREWEPGDPIVSERQR